VSRIEMRIRMAEQRVGINATGDTDTLKDEEIEGLRAVMRMAMENRVSVADLLGQSPCERRQIS
jgi:hypothetical protein